MSTTPSTIPAPASQLPLGTVKSQLKELYHALTDEAKRATFACGGKIPIKLIQHDSPAGSSSPQTLTLVSDQLASNKPVTIRFGPSGAGQTLTLPAVSGDVALQALLNGCEPASFGRGGEDVYDEHYRKATKLDTCDFCTDFSPYEVGIIDIIAQLLLPSVNSDKLGIRAELYKLNAYSGPYGHFKPHVDTPRGDDQFGGALAIRHNGKEILFEWASEQQKSIQWSVFYSDCEHEVLPVTSGNRVTLTYNLYASRGAGKLAGGEQINASPTNLPLYKTLQDALASEQFMRKGGRLGVYLAHSYPFTHSKLFRTVRPALKGVDMALYAALKSSGLGFSLVRDIKGAAGRYDYLDDDYFDEGIDPYDEDNSDYFRSDSGDEYGYDYDSEHSSDYVEGESDAEEKAEKRIAARAAQREEERDLARAERRAEWEARQEAKELADTAELGAEDGIAYPWLKEHGGGMYVKGFGAARQIAGMGDEDTLSESLNGIYYRDEDVTWLNKRGSSELNYAYLTYGNEPGIDTVYTSAAFIIKILPSKKRSQYIATFEEDSDSDSDSNSSSPAKKQKTSEAQDTDAEQPDASATVNAPDQSARDGHSLANDDDDADEQAHEEAKPQADAAIALANAHGMLDTCIAIAKQEYEAESDDQLSFTRGAILLEVMSVPGLGEDWLMGTLKGKKGFFPKACVELKG